tara:strand:- start:26383 stop:27498 length:1116 start_codon:yes stop_codon:yes gene_type:complete
MRTYGVNGGEQQLSQLFAANSNEKLNENFAFLFKDDECAELFRKRSKRLQQITFSQRSQRAGLAWSEFFLLLPYLIFFQWRLWRVLKNRNIDICVVHGFQAALVAWPIAMMYRDIGWAYVHRTTKKVSRLKKIFRLLYAPFNVVAGNSQSVVSSLHPYTDVSKLLALENGINLHEFDAAAQNITENLPLKRGDILISVGRLIPSKGHLMLLEALSNIIDNYPNTKLWIVGEGPEREVLEYEIRKKELVDHVVLLGRRRDVPAVLAKASIYVSASEWEGMSNAVLEGMASGLPAVVGDAPGVSECHIDGVTGLIVDRNPEALAQGVCELLGNQSLAASLGKHSRAHVGEKYSIWASRRRYDTLYDVLLGVKR